MDLTNKYVSIGLICPSVYNYGGHDIESPERQKIIQCLEWILNHYIYKKQKIIGITSLNYGIEEEFVNLCINKGIPYRIYLPYANQEKYWIRNQGYKKLLDSALSVDLLSETGFSGKKIIFKNNLVAQNSDIVVYIENKLKHRCQLLSDILSQGKPTYIIRV